MRTTTTKEERAALLETLRAGGGGGRVSVQRVCDDLDETEREIARMNEVLAELRRENERLKAELEDTRDRAAESRRGEDQ